MSRISKRAILVAGTLLSFPLSVYAAGLGKLTVLSNLGEPLKAEIEVVAVEKGERDSLTARLAAVEAYLQANLPYPSGAWGLKVSLDVRPSGDPFVSISSANPVSEPFVDVLVDLRWNGGRLLRAYTALLDPPAYASPETMPPATPAPTVSAEPAPLSAPPAIAPDSAPAPQAQAAPMDQPATTVPLEDSAPTPSAELNAPSEGAMLAEPQAQASAASPAEPPVAEVRPQEPAPKASEVTSAIPPRLVKRGETLGKIAKEVKPADVTLEQMLVVLYRANPDAFAGRNMNRLKTGKILRVPEVADIASVNPEEARKEVRVQAADWNAWREKIAGSVDATPAITESSQSAAGAITAKVEDKPAEDAAQPKEVLKLSKGERSGDQVAAGGKGTAKERLLALEEEAAAKGKAAAEAQERSMKLEKSIKDMQTLLEIKNKEMAKAEAGSTPAAPAPKPEELAKQPPVATQPDKAATPPVAAQPVPPQTTEQKASVADPAGGEPKPVTAGPPPAIDTAPVAKTEAPATPTIAPEPKPAPAAMPKKAPVAEPSLMQKILGEPLYLAGGAGLLALLGLGGFLAWRRRKAGSDDEEEEQAQDEMMPPDDHAEAVEEMPAVPATAQATEEHGDEQADPVSEAEVYIAYGREAQAEQILKDALETQPERQAVYVKLLEIYHKRRDVAAFAAVAQGLHHVSGGQGEHWIKAAGLGYQLDPSNTLYAEGVNAGPTDPDMTVSGSLDNKLDLDLGLGQGEAGTNTDIDLGDMTLNADQADLDLTNLSGSTESADLDLRTQVLGDATRQMDLGKTMESTAKTQQMPKMDMTANMGRTQEGKSSAVDSLDFDLDLSTIGGGKDATKSEPAGLDLDIGGLSLDSTLDGKSEPRLGLGGSTLPDVDLSSISLDLDGSGKTGNGAKDEHWHDVQTKFDLAKAYQEMGDKEGAREILREVVQEGDDDQKNAAQKVLEALA